MEMEHNKLNNQVTFWVSPYAFLYKFSLNNFKRFMPIQNETTLPSRKYT